MQCFRMIVPLLLLAVIAPPLTADTPQKAPFKHPAAVKAWNRYQYRAKKAREAYEREMATTQAEYQLALRAAAEAVARMGDAEELKRIAEAQDGRVVVSSLDLLNAVPIEIVNTPSFCVLDEAIVLHAPGTAVYRIPAGVQQFSAVGTIQRQGKVRFVVSADDQQLWTSAPVTRGQTVDINVQLPIGAQLLKLTTNPDGSTAYDSGMWLNPRLD